MPDQKISQLTAGGAAQATDLLPVARGATNVSVLAKDLATALERLAASGQSLTGAQATSLVDLAATWNTTGTPTAIKLNVTDTASNAASLLMDLQVGGASRFAVAKSGTITTTNVSMSGWISGATFVATTQLLLDVANQDVVLRRDAAQTLAQRNGTNAQTFRLYNTFTDASNYERGKLEWASNVLRIGTEKLGTGTARALELQTDGTTRVTVNTDGSTTFASHLNLPANCRFNVSGAPSITAIWGAAELRLAANYNLGWSINPGDATSPLDLALVKDAAWTLALRSGTNAQTFNIYNTYTSATNYERLSIAATAAGAVRIRTNKGSGGGTARALELGTDDTTRVTIPTTGGCVVGTAALATNATDGFLYVPTCAGTPTGTPTAQTGTVPIVVDTTNNKLYFYSGAAWRDAGP